MVTRTGLAPTPVNAWAKSSAVRPSMSPAKRNVMCMFSGSIHLAPLSGARISQRCWRMLAGISTAVNRRGISTLRRCCMLGARALDELFHGRENVLGDLGNAACVGMQAIVEVELGVHRHAFKEEGIEDQAVLGGKVGIDALEGAHVVLAQAARRKHAGEQHLGAAGLDGGDDLVEIGSGACGVEAAQRIV